MDLHSVTLDATTHDAVLTHLRSAPERLAFMATAPDSAHVVDWLQVTDGDVALGPWCAELTGDATARFFQWAAKRGGAIIEAHSHLGRWGDPARFSDFDVEGLREWVPHVRWRLGWRAYAAFVVGPTTFDGVHWDGAKGAEPHQLKSLEVIGGPLFEATGLTLGRGAPRYA